MSDAHLPLTGSDRLREAAQALDLEALRALPKVVELEPRHLEQLVGLPNGPYYCQVMGKAPEYKRWNAPGRLMTITEALSTQMDGAKPGWAPTGIGMVTGDAFLDVDFDEPPPNEQGEIAGSAEAEFVDLFNRTADDLPLSWTTVSGRPGRRRVKFVVPAEWRGWLRGWSYKGTALEVRYGDKDGTLKQSVVCGPHPGDPAWYFRFAEGRSPRDIAIAEAPLWLLQQALRMKAARDTAEELGNTAGSTIVVDGTGLGWESWFGQLPTYMQLEVLVGFANDDKLPRRGGKAGTHQAGHWPLVVKTFGAMLGVSGTAAQAIKWFGATTWAKRMDVSELTCGSIEGMFRNLDKPGRKHPNVGTLIWLATRVCDDTGNVLTTDPAKLPDGVIPPTRDPGIVEDDEVAASLRRLQMARFDEARANGVLSLTSVLHPRWAVQLGGRADAFPVAHTMMLPGFLTLAASVLGKKYRVRIKANWTEPSILWIGTVAKASDLKSPVSAEFEWPLKHLENEDIARYKAEYKAHMEKDFDTRGPAPEKPRFRFVTSDTTLEGLGMVLSAPRTNGILSLHDELSGFFASMDAYRAGKGGKDRAAWLSFWSGGGVKAVRKTSEDVYVTESSISIAGSIQPHKLRDLLEADNGQDESGDGMWSRFLWVMPLNPPPLQNDDTTSIHNEMLEMVVRLDTILRHPGVLTVGMTSEAKRAFDEQCDAWVLEARADSSSAREGFLGKMRGYLARLAGILWATDYVAENESMDGLINEGPINLACMERACRLGQFFVDQYDSLAPLVGASEIPPWVAEIRRKGEDQEIISARDVLRWRFAEDGKQAKQRLVRMVTEYGTGRLVEGKRKDQLLWTLN